MKSILLSLILLVSSSSICLADPYDITEVNLKVDRQDHTLMKLTFILNDIPTTDFPNQSASFDNARLLMVKSLDACLNDDSCEKKISYEGYLKEDDTDEDDLDKFYSMTFQSINLVKDDTDEKYDLITFINIKSDATTGEDQTAVTFEPDSTEITLRYRAGSIDEEVSVTAGIETPIKSGFSNLRTSPQNLGLVLSWDKISEVTFADDSEGTYEGARVYIREIETSISVKPRIVTQFALDAEKNPTEGSDIETLDDCTLQADPEASPPTCQFFCTAQGYLNPKLVTNASFQFQTTEFSKISFNDLNIESHYILIPQLLDDGLLTYNETTQTYTASCLVAQPIENYTYAQLSGAGSSKADDPNCFIATAAYGSPLAVELNHLRWFRDKYLRSYSWGQTFIDWYYENSPTWASAIVFHDTLRSLVRTILWIPVTLIKAIRFYPLLLSGTLLMLALLSIFLVWRRKET